MVGRGVGPRVSGLGFRLFGDGSPPELSKFLFVSRGVPSSTGERPTFVLCLSVQQRLRGVWLSFAFFVVLTSPVDPKPTNPKL